MSLVPILLVAHAAQEQRRKSRNAARRRQEERKRQEENNSSRSSYSSYRYTIPYLDCLMYEIDSDEKLSCFFETLKENAEKLREESGKGYRESAQDIATMVDNYQEGRSQIEKKLTDSGIEVKGIDSKGYSLDSFSIVSKESTYDRYTYISTRATFNGLELTTDKLNNPDFKEKYEEQKKKCDELRVQKAMKEKELSRQQSLFKYLPFGKPDRRLQISKIKDALKSIEEELALEEKYRKEMQIFESFTPEQRKTIQRYLIATDYMSRAIDSINKMAREFRGKLPSIDEKDIIEKAFNDTIAELGLEEADIADIFRRMDRVAIRRHRGEFDGKSEYFEYADYGIKGRKKDLVKGFIKHVYEEDPDFVDRNMEEVLEDEETRDKE